MSEEVSFKKACMRLPVVAWWLKNSGGEKDLVGLGSGEHVYQGVYDEKIFLCRITDAESLATDLRLELNAKRLKLCAALKERNDAQDLIAQKDARIAELAAHARGKNKALANALKEIERFDADFKRLGEQYVQALHQITTLRAQLEKLQAPAERGAVVLPERKDPDTYSRGSPDWHAAHAQNECLDEVASLNPAPATADSDVREVK